MMGQRVLSPINRLVRSVETIMHDGPDGNAVLAHFLKGLSSLYGVGVRSRMALFHRRRLKSHRLPCKVVSVGNIAVGGTGKTPMAIYTAQVIRNAGYRVAIVSRGYKGKAEKGGGIVSDGQRLLMPVALAGDEPYLLAQQLLPHGIPVLVGQNRVKSGLLAVRRFDTDVIVLDEEARIVFLNRNASRVIGQDRETILGRDFSRVIEFVGARKMKNPLMRVLSSGESVSVPGRQDRASSRLTIGTPPARSGRAGRGSCRCCSAAPSPRCPRV